MHRLAPDLPLLVLSLNDEQAYGERALEAGARGFMGKEHAADALHAAVERVLSGRRYISPQLAEQLADRLGGRREGPPHEALSPQELRVLLALAGGERIHELAARMHLSPKTVSTYRARLLDKLGVASNVELAAYCARHGLQAHD